MKLNSIYSGFDGEVNFFGQGKPTVFIRLQGCNLNCHWCDTPQAKDANFGSEVTVKQIIERVKTYHGFNKVTITGGEPCYQGSELSDLIFALGSNKYRITVESNGSIEWDLWDNEEDVDSWVVDYKLPSSGQMTKMLDFEYFAKYLGKDDFIKFPITDKEDFLLAVAAQRQMVEKWHCKATFAYSPIYQVISPALVADWITQVPVIISQAVLNVQLHKYIWPNDPMR